MLTAVPTRRPMRAPRPRSVSPCRGDAESAPGDAPAIETALTARTAAAIPVTAMWPSFISSPPFLEGRRWDSDRGLWHEYRNSFDGRHDAVAENVGAGRRPVKPCNRGARHLDELRAPAKTTRTGPVGGVPWSSNRRS